MVYVLAKTDMRFLLLGIFLPLTQLLVAYPEPFVDLMRARYDGAFYDQQAADWEQEALGDCSNEDAWWNYCKTAHYSNRFGSGNYDISALLEQANPELDPEGFVYNYLQFAFNKSLNQVQSWNHLLAAHIAAPDRYEAYPALAAYYEVYGQLDKRNSILKQMHEKEPIPAGVMDYNYNQIVGTPTNGLLITAGDPDTYPSWLLQSTYKLRPDLLLINLSLLVNYPTYRQRIFTELGLDDTSLVSAAEVQPSAILDVLLEQNRPILLAATAHPMVPDLDADRLYLVGLGFQYSRQPVNNLQELHSNYKQRWRMDRLQEPLADDPGQRVADGLNQNYLPALIELYDHYQNSGHPDAQEVRGIALHIAERAGVTDNVRTYLDAAGDSAIPLASTTPGVRARQIERAFTVIPHGAILHLDDQQISFTRDFYMQETEVSNADYQLFLEDLLRQRLFRHIDTASMGETDWISFLPDSIAQLPASELYKMGVPTDDNHPVLNISYRAAELYAQWLSEVYNQDPRRRDGRKVRFRLPTMEEWVYAASSGRNNAPYPWGGPYYRNAKGCYLANFNAALPQDVSPEVRARFVQAMAQSAEERSMSFEELDRKRQLDNCDDGGWLTVPVETYHPNDFGLYQMSGNAAEMLAEEGQIIGGSWLDSSSLLQIGRVEDRSLPHPSTGFRLVMEYLD